MATYQNVEQTNCYRVCRLLLDGGKQLLFHFLEQSIGSLTIDGFLATKKTKIQALHTKFKPVISKSQLDILYPPSGGTDKQKWDITLTTCILTNCVSTLSPLQDQSIKDIRQLRNELYGHIGQFQMDQNEFSCAWTKVKHALQDGVKHLFTNPVSFDLQDLVDDIKDERVVSDAKLKKIQQIYNEWKSTDIAVLDAVQELGRDQKEVLTGIVENATSLVSQSEKLTGIGTSLASQSDKLTGIDTSLASQSDKLTGIDTFLASQSDKFTGIDTSLASQSDKLTGIDNSLASQSNKLTGIGSSLASQSDKLTSIDTSLASQSGQLTGIGTCLASQSDTLTSIDTSLASQSDKLTGIDTSLASQSDKLTGIGTSLASQSEDIAEIKTTVRRIEQSQTSQVKVQATDSLAIDEVTPSSNARQQKENRLSKERQPTNQQQESGYIHWLIGLWWTLVGYFWLLLGFRPIVEQIPSISVEQQADSYLCQEYKDLQSDLMKYYSTYIIKSPTRVQSTYKETDIGNLYVEPNLVLVEHTATTDDKPKEKDIFVEDLFQKEKDCCQQIYVSGDAGMGKTSLCKHLVDAWCQAHSQDPNSNSKNIMTNLKKFDFLFYISLRDANGLYDIKDMIVSQLLSNTNSTDKVLFDLLQHHSEKCLIILDGLDEWTCPKRPSWVPARNLLLRYTIVTLTRPWKMEVIRLKEKDIDQKLEIRGVQHVNTFGKKLVSIFNKQQNTDKRYSHFRKTIKVHGLNTLRDTPILLKQLICLWFHDKPLGKSKTEVYANMVELLFELGEKREDIKEFSISKSDTDTQTVNIPACFKKLERCERYKSLLLLHGKLAFNTLFNEDFGTQLVFDPSEVKSHGICEADVDVCLNVGILTQTIISDNICDRTSMSFLHKTFHEFFAALYIAVHGSDVSNLKDVIGSKCRSVDDLFGMTDMFRFLSGLCPSMMLTLNGCLVAAIDNTKEINCNRSKSIMFHDDIRNYATDEVLGRLQTMILSLCREGSSSVQGPLYLPIPDVVYLPQHVREDTSNYTLELCLGYFPCHLKSLSWHPIRNYNLESFVKIPDESRFTYHLDLSAFTDLGSLVLIKTPEVTWSINEDQLSRLTLYDISSPIVMPTIQKAIRLQTLELKSVVCTESKSKTHCPFKLDLSEHSHLRELYIENIRFESVKLNSSLHHIMMNKVFIHTHGGMSALMSSLSNACSLQSINFQSIHCVVHAWGSHCGYVIDLSKHLELSFLQLKKISPESVILNSSIRTVLMKSVAIAHHGVCHLMLNIASAESLQTIKLTSIECTDHGSSVDCGYEMDLSKLGELKSLELRNMRPNSVTVNPMIEQIVLKDVNILKHEGICSLMSSISSTQSLKSIVLNSVKCTEGGASGCTYTIDLSGNNGLGSINFQTISLGSVLFNPHIRNIEMRHIDIQTHDGICSLMSSLSNAHSYKAISLESITCGEHEDGTDCIYALDLSGSDELNSLELSDISPGSVLLNPSCCRYITVEKIHTLTHDGICSLMSNISSAISAETITVTSVQCRNHASGAVCGYNMDLSRHCSLHLLHLEDISPASVVIASPESCPPYFDIEITNIQSLTHDGICSLMSGISNAQLATDITLTSVQCIYHDRGADCGYKIEFSKHCSLYRLHLEDISPATVVIASPDSCPPYNTISVKNIKTLTHDGICSLMSGVSNAHSAVNVYLTSIKCKDHMNGTECGYTVDFSRYISLQELHLQDLSPTHVVLHYPKSMNDNLRKYRKDISRSSQPHSDISSLSDFDFESGWRVVSVRRPDFLNITLKDIHTLSHNTVCKLISCTEKPHPEMFIDFTSIRCVDYAKGINCGQEIGHKHIASTKYGESSDFFADMYDCDYDSTSTMYESDGM